MQFVFLLLFVVGVVGVVCIAFCLQNQRESSPHHSSLYFFHPFFRQPEMSRPDGKDLNTMRAFRVFSLVIRVSRYSNPLIRLF